MTMFASGVSSLTNDPVFRKLNCPGLMTRGRVKTSFARSKSDFRLRQKNATSASKKTVFFAYTGRPSPLPQFLSLSTNIAHLGLSCWNFRFFSDVGPENPALILVWNLFVIRAEYAD